MLDRLDDKAELDTMFPCVDEVNVGGNSGPWREASGADTAVVPLNLI